MSAISEENDSDHITEKKNGYTPIPHDMLEILYSARLTDRERRIILLLLRLTSGCHQYVCLFKNKRQAGDCLNLDKSNTYKTLCDLIEKNIIQINQKKNYILNYDINQWVIELVPEHNAGIMHSVVSENIKTSQGKPEKEVVLTSFLANAPAATRKEVDTTSVKEVKSTSAKAPKPALTQGCSTPLKQGSVLGGASPKKEEIRLERQIRSLSIDIINNAEGIFKFENTCDCIKWLMKKYDIDLIGRYVPFITSGVKNLTSFLGTACEEEWPLGVANPNMVYGYRDVKKIVDCVLTWKKEGWDIALIDSDDLLIKLRDYKVQHEGTFPEISIEEIETLLLGVKNE